jgi:hypothetical protein
MPCAELDGGTTVGITLTAGRDEEGVVLALGEALEDALDGRYVDRLALSD